MLSWFITVTEIWLCTFNVHCIIKLWDIKEALYEADLELEAADLQLVFDLEPWWCRFESIYLSALLSMKYYKTPQNKINQNKIKCSFMHVMFLICV